MRKFKVSLFILAVLSLTLLSPGQTGQKPTKESPRERINRLEKELENTGNNEKKVDILISLGTGYLYFDTARSDDYAHQAVALAEKINYSPGVAWGLYIYGIAANSRGEYDSSLEHLFKCLEMMVKLKDKKGEANARNGIGFAYKKKGEWEKALEYYSGSLKIREEMGDKGGMSASYNNIGNIYNNRGLLGPALEYFLKSLKLMEELDNKRGISILYNNIGKVHYMRDEMDKALEYNLKSLKIKEELGDKLGISYTYNNLGSIYSARKQFDKALEYNFKGLKLAREMKAMGRIAASYTNIGSNYFKKGDDKKALEYFLKSEAIDRESGEKAELANDYFNIGRAYRAMGEKGKALNYFTRSLDLGKETDDFNVIIDAAGALADMHAKMGNYKLAYQHHLLFKEKSDVLKNRETTQKITRMEMRYEFDKTLKQKEHEQHKKDLLRETDLKKQTFLRHVYFSGFLFMTIFSFLIYRGFRMKKKTSEILAKQQDEIVKQSIELELANLQLKELNATKDKFFSIIAHDLKNPFSGLMGLLKMIVLDFDVMEKEDIKELLESIHESSEKTYSLLENLLHWSRSQTGGLQMNPRTLELKEAVDHSIQLLKHHAKSKGIRLENEIRDDDAVVADEHMIQTVFRNLISNAIKFTPPGGTVRTSSRRTDGTVVASVSDTGVGIAREHLPKLFRIDSKFVREGTAKEQGTGLGLILCKEFIERNGGTIEVESEPGKGSTFVLSIPAP